MRASDRDREPAPAALRAGCAEGYLSIDTFERRVGRVMVRPGDELWLGCCPVRLS
jgi:hypothetical protein